MDEMQSVIPPTPSMMPKRKVQIRRPPQKDRRTKYAVAVDIPRCGWSDATIWPDTGILIMIGIRDDLVARFRNLYKRRTRVATAVEKEIRSHSNVHPPEEAPTADFDRVRAASRIVNKVFIGDQKLPVIGLDASDLDRIDEVSAKLRGLSNEPTKRHGGEAETIVLAARFREISSKRHILLTNDGNASVVAAHYGIPSRHAAEVLAEFSCADPKLTAEECFKTFQISLPLTAPPTSTRPANADYFKCSMTDGACPQCVTVEGGEASN